MAIKTCSCKHEYQDKTYGKNRRVMNRTEKKSGSTNLHRCTVCNQERS